ALQDLVAQRRRAAHSLNAAVEIGEHRFGGLLKNISIEFGDPWLDDSCQNRPQLSEAIGLLARGQPAVAGYQNCRQSTLDALSHFLRHDRYALYLDGQNTPRLIVNV